jgi:hypothetical protein
MSEYRSEQVIERDEGIERGPWLVGLVVVVGFLLASILGMASSSSPWAAHDDGGSAASVPAAVGDVLALILAVGVCGLVALLWARTPGSRKAAARKVPGVPEREDVRTAVWSSTVVLVAGVVALVFVTLAFWLLLEQANLGQGSPPPTVTSQTPTTTVPAPGPQASPAFTWFALGLAGSIAVLLPIALVIRHRRRPSDALDPADEIPGSVARALRDSIDEIDRDPDSRRAIIRAYARMEDAFDDAGTPRRPYETPFEYVGRALRGVRVSPPAVGRLAALFERARFSQHAVAPETKEDAVDAIRAIERQMKEPPA